MISIAVLGFFMILIGLMLFVTGLGQTISFGTPLYMIMGILLVAGGISINYRYGWKRKTKQST
jgi:hypothetical protein